MIALDRYKTVRVEALQQELHHVVERKRKVTLALVLCLCYDEFHQASVNRICAESSLTYTEAEQAAEFFGGMFDMDVPTDAFLPDENRINAAIDHYNKYREHREIVRMFGYEDGDIDAFCRQVEHAPWKVGLMEFFMFNSIGYLYAMRSVYEYLEGNISFDQMQKGLVVFFPPELRPMPKGQIFSFAKTMFRVVREFDDIARKRVLRSQKYK